MVDMLKIGTTNAAPADKIAREKQEAFDLDQLESMLMKADAIAQDPNSSEEARRIATEDATFLSGQVTTMLDDGELTGYGKDQFSDKAALTGMGQEGATLQEGDGNFPGSFTGSVVKGIKDVPDAAAQMLYNALPEGAQQAGNQANNWLAENTGLVDKIPEGNFNHMLGQDEANFQEYRKRAGRDGFDGGRMLGNLAATSPALFAKPFQMVNAGKDVFGGANLARGIGQGATFGVSQPVLNDSDNFWEQKGYQAGFGGAGGGLGTVGGNMLSRIVSPNTRRQVTRLREQGVNPTPGGILGGNWKILEDKIGSLPIVGGVINSAKRKAQEELNRAAYKRALVGTGVDEKAIPVGPEGIEVIKNTLDKAYNKVYPKLTFKKDATFNRDLAELKEGALGLTDSSIKIFDRVVKNLDKKVSQNGSMLGETFKEAEGEIRTMAGNYLRSGLESERALGRALKQLQNLMGQQLKRDNPRYASKLNEIRKNWANYEIINKAGSAAGDQTAHGFTAAQLGSAVKNNKKYNPKGSYGYGKARMQDLSGDGISALGSKYPDSGTTGRYLSALASTGGAYSLFNPAAIPTVLGVAGTLGAASIPYLARKTTADLLTKRPQSAKALANAIRKFSPALGAGGTVGSQ